MKKRKKADVVKKLSPLEVAHEMARGLHQVGAMDVTTLREFDSLCLPKVKDFTANQIKKIRLRERLSQSVFAKCLNTSASTIKQWEQGEKHPRGTSLKLLNLVCDKGILVLM